MVDVAGCKTGGLALIRLAGADNVRVADRDARRHLARIRVTEPSVERRCALRGASSAGGYMRLGWCRVGAGRLELGGGRQRLAPGSERPCDPVPRARDSADLERGRNGAVVEDGRLALVRSSRLDVVVAADRNRYVGGVLAGVSESCGVRRSVEAHVTARNEDADRLRLGLRQHASVLVDRNPRLGPVQAREGAA